MWILTLVILVNGGTSPTKFETSTFTTKQQCEIAADKRETDSTYGYCSFSLSGGKLPNL
jgi:hypothetical protein